MKKVKCLFLTISILCLLTLTACGCSHEWIEATCTQPKTCSKCNEIEGEAFGHTEGDWVITERPSIVDSGTEKLLCSVCDESLDERELDKKVPEVVGNHFNFTDEELIDWINAKTTATIGYSELGIFDEDSGNTSYRVTDSDDNTGALILHHDEDDNINAVMCYFEEWESAAAVVMWVGEKIDSDFSFDEAIIPVAYGKSYSSAGMTIVRLELSDNFEVSVLAPTEYFNSIR